MTKIEIALIRERIIDAAGQVKTSAELLNDCPTYVAATLSDVSWELARIAREIRAKAPRPEKPVPVPVRK